MNIGNDVCAFSGGSASTGGESGGQQPDHAGQGRTGWADGMAFRMANQDDLGKSLGLGGIVLICQHDEIHARRPGELHDWPQDAWSRLEGDQNHRVAQAGHG